MKKEPSVYFCADDFGLDGQSCDSIAECVKNGVINKVSVFANSRLDDLSKRVAALDGAVLCPHLNFVEGCCVGQKEKLTLLCDENGIFKHTFAGLLFLSIFKRKRLQEEIFLETSAQLERFFALAGKNRPLFLDSHQHVHMIPPVLSAICGAAEKKGLSISYLRTPSEAAAPFLACPSLYLSCVSVNLIKQWLLKFLNLLNQKTYRRFGIKWAEFLGIMFSGNMTEERVERLLPKITARAAKKGRDAEILFHPGFTDEELKSGVKFHSFYKSPGRKNEYNAAINLKNKKA